MINIREITTVEDYEKFKNNEGPEGTLNILKASANWCGPCKVLTERIKGLDETKLKNIFFGELDVDNEVLDDVVSSLRIRNIPVMIYYRNGEELYRSIGLVSNDDIYKKIEELK